MNLILIKPSDYIAENIAEISDFRFEHIKVVLKVQIGAILKIGELNGKIGTGKIVQICDKSVKLETVFDKNPPAKNSATLFCALPRPKVFRRVLLNAVCFGVKEIHFFQSFKVEKSYWQSPFLSQKSLDEIVENALMQAVDTVFPKIYFHKSFKIFVEDIFAEKAKSFPCVVFHPSDDVGAYCIRPNCAKIEGVCNTPLQRGVVIGPEGGFTDYEIDMFLKNNAKIASLGERILRVEQAVSVVLSQFNCDNLKKRE
ncbi:MAG: 16S rRNA (uracil(1498)-N(3))-methyltransferase [Chitinivibrionia bacterium]|nr:16S rRNA (uracil(1498)-N(3))-methyltransferase [Chitinivibrionia bacterium]